MDKFLLAENPLSDSGDLAIIRTVSPVAIFQVHFGHLNVPEKFHKHYSADKHNKFTLSIQHFVVVVEPKGGENIFFSEKISDDKMYRYIDDAWEWLLSYYTSGGHISGTEKGDNEIMKALRAAKEEIKTLTSALGIISKDLQENPLPKKVDAIELFSEFPCAEVLVYNERKITWEEWDLLLDDFIEGHIVNAIQIRKKLVIWD